MDLSEQLLERVHGQTAPGDGVCDGGEDPVKFTQQCPSVSQNARDFVNDVGRKPILGPSFEHMAEE